MMVMIAYDQTLFSQVMRIKGRSEKWGWCRDDAIQTRI
jgi:hypothetical protein